MKYFTSQCRMHSIYTITVVLLLLVGISSCSKDLRSSDDGPTVVRIQMLGTESDTGNNTMQKRASIRGIGAKVSASQVFTIPFSENLKITAILEEIGSTENAHATKHVSSPRDTNKKAAIQRDPLDKDIKYGILVYDDQGNLFAEKEYTHGYGYSSVSDTIGGMTAGKDYTFLGYSINSTTELPGILNKETLSEAQTRLTSKDLMTFKKVQRINEGSNTLDVILKHRFTEVYPSISLGAEPGGFFFGGEIRSVGPASFIDTREAAAAKFSDESLSYSEATKNTSITFAESGTSWTADPVLLLNPAGTPGNFTIYSLNVNGITKNVVINDMKLEPGKKYNLSLTFNAPCVVQTTMPINMPDQYVKPFRPNANDEEFTFFSSDRGAVIDIFKLDNSMSLLINGQELYIGSHAETSTSPQTSTNEIQFEGYDVGPAGNWVIPGEYPNIKFADGSVWGKQGIPEVFRVNSGLVWMPGQQGQVADLENSKPSLRLVLTRTQDDKVSVEMYGVKSEANVVAGILEPLELVNEAMITRGDGSTRYIRGQFNPDLKWNRVGNNVVRVRQYGFYNTFMFGKISGEATVDCED